MRAKTGDRVVWKTERHGWRHGTVTHVRANGVCDVWVAGAHVVVRVHEAAMRTEGRDER